MKLKTKEILTPFKDGEIIIGQVLDKDTLEFLIVKDDHSVSVFNPESQVLSLVHTLPDSFYLKDIEVYSYKDYCAIVDNHGLEGIVINIQNLKFKKDLKRGSYQVEHCSFPIAFYEENNKTYLIHGTDWNRLDITCLETEENLTEREIDFKTKTNYKDYFHSLLSISPDQKKFLSNGWVWTPVDVITKYELSSFLKDYELCSELLDFPETSGYLWDRPLVWIDSNIVAIAYNKQEEHKGRSFPSELIFVDVNKNDIEKRIDFDGFGLDGMGETNGKLFHNTSDKCLMAFSEENGLTIADYEGLILLTEENFKLDGYSQKHNLFFEFKEEKLLLTEIEK